MGSTNNLVHQKVVCKSCKPKKTKKLRTIFPIFNKKRSLLFETKFKMNLKTTIISTILSVLCLISQTACIVVRPTKPYIDCAAKQSVMEMTGPARMQCYISQSPNPDGFRQCIRDSQQKAYDYQYSEWTHRQQAIDEWLRPWFLKCLRQEGRMCPNWRRPTRRRIFRRGC